MLHGESILYDKCRYVNNITIDKYNYIRIVNQNALFVKISQNITQIHYYINADLED